MSASPEQLLIDADVSQSLQRWSQHGEIPTQVERHVVASLKNVLEDCLFDKGGHGGKG